MKALRPYPRITITPKGRELYGYAMKLRLLERQRSFSHDRGKQAFDSLMDDIRQQISSL